MSPGVLKLRYDVPHCSADTRGVARLHRGDLNARQRRRHHAGLDQPPTEDLDLRVQPQQLVIDSRDSNLCCMRDHHIFMTLIL